MDSVVIAERDDRRVMVCPSGTSTDRVSFILQDRGYGARSGRYGTSDILTTQIAFVGKRRFYQFWKYFQIDVEREFGEGSDLTGLGTIFSGVIALVCIISFSALLLSDEYSLGFIDFIITAVPLVICGMLYKIQRGITVTYVPPANEVRAKFESMVEQGTTRLDAPADEYIELLKIEREYSFLEP